MSHYPHPILAREGWPFIGLSLFAALLATVLVCWWSLPFWIVFVFVVQFFRDPPRAVPGDAKSVLSPADGRIVVVGPARDPWLDREALKISVFMNVFNVHSNRADTGHDVTCVQVAGLIARRILCYVNGGAKLARGQRYGFIRFGSRVDLYLPTDAKVRVTIGDKVRATETILAELP
jgi:phosphatidylserine decarboxylase